MYVLVLQYELRNSTGEGDGFERQHRGGLPHLAPEVVRRLFVALQQNYRVSFKKPKSCIVSQNCVATSVLTVCIVWLSNISV